MIFRPKFGLLLITTVCLPAIARAATFGHLETFPGTGLSGWDGGTPLSNPGTGGVEGAGDGFLQLANQFNGNFGVRVTTPPYTGDWTAAGITEVSFYLNDVGADQPFSIHLLISDSELFTTTWQHNVGFSPPEGSWQKFTVELGDGSNWTRIRGSASFAQVLQSVGTMHFRHDVAPFFSSPDPIAGDLGIDNVLLGDVCDPAQDEDGDGVGDACDLCPGTVPGSPVDADGCPPTIPGDFDGNGAVDLTDFDHFRGCALGPAIPQTSPACADAHFDADPDIDMHDFAIFQRCFSGDGIPGDPACAG